MNTILTYVRPKLASIGLGFCLKFFGTVVELLLPWMLSVILDQFVPLKDLYRIVLWGVLMVACAALALLLNVLANRMATATSGAITKKLRHDLFARVLHLSSAQEDYFTTPSLITRLTSDTYYVHQMIDRMQRLGVRAPILLVGGIAITLMLDPMLTLVLIATLPLLGLVIWLVSSKGIALYQKTQLAQDGLLRRAQESILGMRIIKALSKTDYEQASFDRANHALTKQERHVEMLMSITNPTMNLVLNLGLTLVVVVGAFRVNTGLTQAGTIIAFLSYFAIILNALMMVSRLFVMYAKGVASGNRIAEILNAPQEMEPKNLPKKADTAHIRFTGVDFSYGKQQQTLQGISFALNQGETLGIIGPTGSGKSTILRLLLRFYNPDAGEITINGSPLCSITPAVLYTLFGVVQQNDFLYAGEIGENIAFGRDLDQGHITQAAQTAQGDFIQDRKGGFAAAVTPKGTNLSGGQRQRLLIARALAANPQILILDDSSSALDYKTDAALRKALRQEFPHTTKLIVTQRVSSICHAEKILVLQNGAIVGYGTHKELLQRCKDYRTIAEIQMGGGA